jgi:hypothetical protein
MRCRGLAARKDAFIALANGSHPQQFTQKQRDKYLVPDTLMLVFGNQPSKIQGKT